MSTPSFAACIRAGGRAARVGRLLLVLGSLGLMSACATLPEPTPEEQNHAWQLRQQHLQGLNDWRLEGRLAIRSGEEGWQAALNWRRQMGKHVIDLTGPLGQGHVRVSQDVDGAQLQDNGRRTYYAATARELLQQATGWDVPLESMNYWVLGLPVPELPSHWQLDRAGRLEQLEQDGWQVRFLAYAVTGQHELPSRIFIARTNGGTDGPLEVRLAIGRWIFNHTDNQ